MDGKDKYLYNGKELQEETGLYEYGARYYDPARLQFTSIDPLAKKYSFQGTYVYANNNPVRYQDYNGEGAFDMVIGAAAAFLDNATGGVLPVREAAAGLVRKGEEADFNHGQDAVDIGSVIVGAALTGGGASMIDGGTGAMMIGLAAEVPSGGTSTVVVAGGATAVVAGAGVILAGVAIGTNAASSLANGKGRLNKDGNNKPTKNERAAEKKAKKSNDSQYGGGAEHTSNASPSKAQKHQEGRARNQKDKGGEKADNRRYRSQDSKKKKNN